MLEAILKVKPDRVNNNYKTGEDTNSHMIKHLVEANHTTVKLRNFAVLNSGYRHRKFKSKVSIEFFIKHNRNLLNDI